VEYAPTDACRPRLRTVEPVRLERGQPLIEAAIHGSLDGGQY
jgi:hypothetical protein